MQYINTSNTVEAVVDPSLAITANGNMTGFKVTITGSDTAGDILSYTSALPFGISAAPFNTTTRSLVFSTTTNWQTLLRTVTIKTVSAICYQEQRHVNFVMGKVYYNTLNGHFYDNFLTVGIDMANTSIPYKVIANVSQDTCYRAVRILPVVLI